MVGTAIVVGCGGEEETTPGGAASDDAGAEGGSVEAGCGNINDILGRVPDASIGDSGASTSQCLGCVQRNCQAPIAECNVDCTCVTSISGALTCIERNPSEPIACAAPLATLPAATRNIGFKLLACVQTSCQEECATDELSDGGTGDEDAGDGG